MLGSMWLRAGVPEDTQRLLAIQRAASVVGYREIFPAEQYPFPEQQVLAECWALLTDPECQVLVGVGDDGTAVGFVAREGDQISRLYVDPAHWGRGYGSRLLAAAVDGARADGYRIARLWVLEANRVARGLYERRGWRIDGRTGTASAPPYPVEVGYHLDLVDLGLVEVDGGDSDGADPDGGDSDGGDSDGVTAGDGVPTPLGRSSGDLSGGAETAPTRTDPSRG